MKVVDLIQHVSYKDVDMDIIKDDKLIAYHDGINTFDSKYLECEVEDFIIEKSLIKIIIK